MKKVIVTTSWDDGHMDDLKIAKLLKKYKVQGTFYISPKDREFKKTELLNLKQILELNKDFEIGAHTLNHKDLNKLGEKEARSEILKSKTVLEKIIKKKITSFCYPYGSFNSKTKEIVKNIGFSIARTVNQIITKPSSDLYELGTTVEFTPLSLLGIYGQFKLATSHKNFSFVKKMTFSWEKNAKILFDNVLGTGGVYHLWGHSMLINKRGHMEKLEELLAYISKRNGVLYLNNSKAIKQYEKH